VVGKNLEGTGGVRRAMEMVAAEYGGGNAHRGGGSWKECHGVGVNFGCNVTCVWIFAVAPQFLTARPAPHHWRGSHATA
jgi:hypothetical protein